MDDQTVNMMDPVSMNLQEPSDLQTTADQTTADQTTALVAIATKMEKKNPDALLKATTAALESVQLWASIGFVMGLFMVIMFLAILVLQWTNIYLLQFGLIHFNFVPVIHSMAVMFVMVVLITYNNSNIFLRALVFAIGFGGLISIISHLIYIIRGFFVYGACSKIERGIIVITNTTIVTSSLGTGPQYALCQAPTSTFFLVTNIIIYVWMLMTMASIVLCFFMALKIEKSIISNLLVLTNKIATRRDSKKSKSSIGHLIVNEFKNSGIPLSYIDMPDDVLHKYVNAPTTDRKYD